MSPERKGHSHASWRQNLHSVIFEAETTAGKLFDEILLVFILLSVLVVMLDSVHAISVNYTTLLHVAEWFFTIVFSIEFLLRLLCVGRPLRYARSFFGVIDLVAILPTYLALVLPASKYFLVIRVLRLLRIFRILKLVKYLGEAGLLMDAMRASRRKITVFLFVVFLLVLLMGSLMYVIEGESHGFTSIPKSVYWAIVTLTTVGYGDVAPETPLGMALASIIMIMGYGIIAVPTGIVTVEMGYAMAKKASTRCCHECGFCGHDDDATFCKKCGSEL